MLDYCPASANLPAGSRPRRVSIASRPLFTPFLRPFYPLFSAVANSIDDFYHQKTDAELQFFAAHPDFYQPSLIDAARGELRRRGVGPAPLAPLETASFDYTPAPTGLRTGPLTLGLAAVLLVGMGGFYAIKQMDKPMATAEKPKAAPHLEEVATSVVPDYGPAVRTSVQRQVQRVPPGERATAAAKVGGMALRQYRELTKRFWTAECQTEYVFEQARLGKMDAALPGHIESVMITWQQWNKTTAYRYQFGPKMTQHLDAMARVARQQQEGLQDLLIVSRNPQPYETAKTRQREADVNDLLSSLLPKSPVTARPYPGLVRKMHL